MIDLLFVMKDADGAVTTIAAQDLDPETGPSFMAIDVAQPGALGSEDAEEVSDDLPLNSSALLIAFENSWAAKVVAACQAGGRRRHRPDPHPGRRRPGRPDRLAAARRPSALT